MLAHVTRQDGVHAMVVNRGRAALVRSTDTPPRMGGQFPSGRSVRRDVLRVCGHDLETFRAPDLVARRAPPTATVLQRFGEHRGVDGVAQRAHPDDDGWRELGHCGCLYDVHGSTLLRPGAGRCSMTYRQDQCLVARDSLSHPGLCTKEHRAVRNARTVAVHRFLSADPRTGESHQGSGVRAKHDERRDSPGPRTRGRWWRQSAAAPGSHRRARFPHRRCGERVDAIFFDRIRSWFPEWPRHAPRRDRGRRHFLGSNNGGEV